MLFFYAISIPKTREQRMFSRSLFIYTMSELPNKDRRVSMANPIAGVLGTLELQLNVGCSLSDAWICDAENHVYYPAFSGSL